MNLAMQVPSSDLALSLAFIFLTAFLLIVAALRVSWNSVMLWWKERKR